MKQISKTIILPEKSALLITEDGTEIVVIDQNAKVVIKIEALWEDELKVTEIK